MKAYGDFGTSWITDLINIIVKDGCIPDDWRKSILCTREKVIHWCAAHTQLLSYWSSSLEQKTGRKTKKDIAPKDTAYKRWSCHSGFKLLCKLCRTSPPPAMGARFTVFGHAGHADPLDGWRCCSQKRVMSRPIQVRQL